MVAVFIPVNNPVVICISIIGVGARVVFNIVWYVVAIRISNYKFSYSCKVALNLPLFATTLILNYISFKINYMLLKGKNDRPLFKGIIIVNIQIFNPTQTASEIE
jgi:hypothetical protein